MRRKTIVLSWAVLVAAILVAYWNHFDNGFHFDDTHAVEDNIYIRSIKNIPRFFTDGTTFSALPTNQTYRPVVLTTLAVDYWLGRGPNPVWFHVGTFVLFLMQGLLMCLLFCKILSAAAGEGTRRWGAFLAVAWYLLHPANAETVNYVSARSDSISTLFVLLGLVLYAYSRLARKTHLYLVAVALGILTKAQAAIFAPLLLLYVACIEGPVGAPRGDYGRAGAGLLVALKKTMPAFAVCILMLVFVQKMTPDTWTAGGASMYRYVITQPYVMMHYVRTFLVPTELSADTDWAVFESLWNVRALVGLGFLVGFLIVAIALWRKSRTRPISFGMLWFVIALIPTSFVVPLAEVMNDHRVFFPYVGLSLSVSWLLVLVSRRVAWAWQWPARTSRSLAAISVVVLLSIYAYGTYRRNEVWHNEESLWFDVTLKSPANGRGLMNYGLTQMSKGNYEIAEDYFVRALKYTPRYAYLHVNLGVLYGAMNRLEDAEAHFQTALKEGLRYPATHYHYAGFLNNRGRSYEAIQQLRETLTLSPSHEKARHMLMEIYRDRHEYGHLEKLANETLVLAPSDLQATISLEAVQGMRVRVELAAREAETNRTPEVLQQLSLLFYQMGQYRESIEAATEALLLKPDYDLAYNNICAANNELGEWDKAIQAGEQALKLNPDNQLAQGNLAWARRQKAQSEK